MSKKIHGLRHSRTYRIYRNMRSRCDNPNFDSYPYYGGRGITYDPTWATFAGFLSDMGEAPEGLTLERRDGNGNYTKDNCCWVTRVEQMNNKSDNVHLTVGERTQTVAQWARDLDLSPHRIRMRLKRGATAEYALAPGVAPKGRTQRKNY